MNDPVASFSGTGPWLRVRVEVRGAVQGVGFRPFVYQAARILGLSGWVENTTFGVCLEAEGESARIAALLDAIEHSPPSNASIASVEIQQVELAGGSLFVIRPSALQGAPAAQILPDLATCDDCLGELFDPTDRRYLYPFINCTHCGPRYSIVEDVPYDRVRTSMRHFPMCPDCRAEYEDPSNRRFHAEPNACADCGPHIAFWDGTGACLARDQDALLKACAAIRMGKIVAVKGIGGFHLVADARSERAVTRLRARKNRPHKPLAVMFPLLAAVERECIVTPEEKVLLTSAARPIVLVRRKPGTIAASVAPSNPWLGVYLPYAPLHHLLLHELGFPVVATSGNLSDEPIAIDENEALQRLSDIADVFLIHNRPIVRALDDSVVRIVGGREMMLRRARGFAPAPIAVEGLSAGVLALGGHMKTTVALTEENSVLMSQHLGDLETVAARDAHERAVADLVQLRGHKPNLIVRDLHPDYATSRIAAGYGLPMVSVQHHLAHVVACMAEQGIVPPVLGVAWDGTGYGSDGTIWGGEFFLVTESGWRRVAHLRTFPLPGGEAAAREPRRAAIGLLYEAFGKDAFALDVPPFAGFSRAERDVLQAMLEQGVNAPRCSSMGRLFDGFAALCGLRQQASYEGQAAAEFEWAADAAPSHAPYDFAVKTVPGAPLVVNWQPALEALLADRRDGVPARTISASFHAGLAAAIASVAKKIGEPCVVLSGGCFQNLRLTEAAIEALRAIGHQPIWHRRVPPNDGGLALGQAVWAAWHKNAGDSVCV